MTRDKILETALPPALGILILAAWEWAVWFFGISVFVLPAPSAIGAAFIENWHLLLTAAQSTLAMTALAFAFKAWAFNFNASSE